MKRTGLKNGLVTIVVLCTGFCFADTSLNTKEIGAILKQLTDFPRNTWLDHGTIQSRHLEYYKDEDTLTETSHTFVFDGTRFLWDIEILPATPDNNIEKIHKSKRNFLSDNQHRIFCWDGQTYTRYYKSGKQASVEQNQYASPQQMFGAFSKGVIPWGHGFYTYENLLSCQPIGWKTVNAGRDEIHLELTRNDSTPTLKFNFILDPAKNYAILSFSIKAPGLSEINQFYDQHIKIGETWLPQIIYIERNQIHNGGKVLISYEDCKLIKIDENMPSADSFKIDFISETLVEMKPFDGTPSWLYYTTDKSNISKILEDKKSLLNQGTAENCATAAARHVANRMSRTISKEKLSEIVSKDTYKTNLYQLRQTLEEAGLHCDSVKIDLDSLRKLTNSKAILHLSASNHYVVLDHIDNKYVWYVDLVSRKFFWKKNINEFLQEWTDGTALVVSEHPISLPVASRLLSEETQMLIKGGDTNGYSCEELIQPDGFDLCPEPIGGLLCCGSYYKYRARKGCRQIESNGTCTSDGFIGYEYDKCIQSIVNPGGCDSEGKWIIRKIRACE